MPAEGEIRDVSEYHDVRLNPEDLAPPKAEEKKSAEKKQCRHGSVGWCAACYAKRKYDEMKKDPAKMEKYRADQRRWKANARRRKGIPPISAKASTTKTADIKYIHGIKPYTYCKTCIAAKAEPYYSARHEYMNKYHHARKGKYNKNRQEKRRALSAGRPIRRIQTWRKHANSVLYDLAHHKPYANAITERLRKIALKQDAEIKLLRAPPMEDITERVMPTTPTPEPQAPQTPETPTETPTQEIQYMPVEIEHPLVLAMGRYEITIKRRG